MAKILQFPSEDRGLVDLPYHSAYRTRYKSNARVLGPFLKASRIIPISIIFVLMVFAVRGLFAALDCGFDKQIFDWLK